MGAKVASFDEASAEFAAQDGRLRNVEHDAGQALRELVDVRAAVKDVGDRVATLHQEKADREANNEALIARVEENVRRAMRGSMADVDTELRQTVNDIRTAQLAKAQAQSARARVELVSVVLAAAIVVLGMGLHLPTEATIGLAGVVAWGGSRARELKKKGGGDSVPPPPGASMPPPPGANGKAIQ